MKRFFYALIVLLWTLPAFGQVPMTGAGLGSPTVASGCSQATTFLARLSNHTNDAAYTQWICNRLVPDGFWTGGAKACDLIHVFATQNTTDALLNLPSVVTTSLSNAPTFTTQKGYAGNGTSATVQVTGYNFNAGTAYTQNSATIWAYTIMTAVDNGYSFGNSAASNTNDNIQPFNFGSVFSGGINSTTQLGSAALANGNGLFTLSRTSSTQTDAYQDTTSIATNAANTSATIVSASPWYLGLASTAFMASTSTVVAGGVCKGWAAGDVSTFRTGLYEYLHTVNAAVFP